MATSNNNNTSERMSDDVVRRLEARFARRLRVVTEPKHSNKMHRTRTLSELILLTSPSTSPRVTPQQQRRTHRFDMDIEVSARFADNEGGVVDLLEARRRRNVGFGFSTFSTTSVVDETALGSRSSDLFAIHHENDDDVDNVDTNQTTHELADDVVMTGPTIESMTTDIDILDSVENVDLAEPAAEPEPESEIANAHSVGSVIDMLFEIHSALKTRHVGGRTAASALAASNLVTTVAFPTPLPRDEERDAIENTRKMLECAICQEVFSFATEATCCGQVFCKECIERWVKDRGSCPMCRDAITFATLVPSRHAQRMANEMMVTCSYCTAPMKKAGLLDHVASCALAPVEPPPPADVALRNLLLATARLNAAAMAAFLTAPSPPQARMMQCYIRTRGGGNYELYTQDTDVLLCTAVRRRQYDMSVSFSIYVAAADSNSQLANTHLATGAPTTQVARLEKNYMGSQYTMFDTTGDAPIELGAVQYAATFGKSPRQMRVALPLVAELPDVATSNNSNSTSGEPTWSVLPWTPSHKDDTILAQVENPDASKALHLINKPPVWIESLEAYCLDFGGRVAAASVKNFLLSHPDDMDKTLMLFGRTQDRQVYSMDYSHPFTPVQAFAIALSSMDSHLVTFD